MTSQQSLDVLDCSEVEARSYARVSTSGKASWDQQDSKLTSHSLLRAPHPPYEVELTSAAHGFLSGWEEVLRAFFLSSTPCSLTLLSVPAAFPSCFLPLPAFGCPLRVHQAAVKSPTGVPTTSLVFTVAGQKCPNQKSSREPGAPGLRICLVQGSDLILVRKIMTFLSNK